MVNDPQRYVVIDDLTGCSTNVVLWDGMSDFDPGDGHSLMLEVDYVPPAGQPEPDAAHATVVVEVDPAALDAARTAVGKATTVGGMRAAVTQLIDTLAPS